MAAASSSTGSEALFWAVGHCTQVLLCLHTERHNTYTHKIKIHKIMGFFKDQNEKKRQQKGKRRRKGENKEENQRGGRREGGAENSPKQMCYWTVSGRQASTLQIRERVDWQAGERTCFAPSHTQKPRARAFPQSHTVLLEKTTRWVWL